MTDAAVACPLCGALGPKPFVRKWKQYSLHDCPACGIGFCLPFQNPGAGFYHAFEDLYPHQAQTEPDPMSFEYGETLKRLRREPPPGRRLLDVGCGGGGFLNVARAEGFDVAGIDFNEVRLKLIRSQLGIENVFHGSIRDFARKRPEATFDVVTMFQVLEHLDDPADWLAAIRGLLVPGGRLFVGVPNRHRTFDQFQGPGMEQLDNPPNHLTRWDKDALARFVAKAGFEVRDTRALGVPRPLLALLLRNNLRFGLATKALNVDELQHAKPAAAGGPAPAKASVVKALVGVKEAVINAAAFAGYPAFLLAKAALGWQGSVLLCEAAKPR